MTPESISRIVQIVSRRLGWIPYFNFYLSKRVSIIGQASKWKYSAFNVESIDVRIKVDSITAVLRQ